MKRYLFFRGSVYYPSGGMRDFGGDFDSLEAAEAALGEWMKDHRWRDEEYMWWHVFDSTTRTIVKSRWGGDDDTPEPLPDSKGGGR